MSLPLNRLDFSNSYFCPLLVSCFHMAGLNVGQIYKQKEEMFPPQTVEYKKVNIIWAGEKVTLYPSIRALPWRGGSICFFPFSNQY